MSFELTLLIQEIPISITLARGTFLIAEQLYLKMSAFHLRNKIYVLWFVIPRVQMSS